MALINTCIPQCCIYIELDPSWHLQYVREAGIAKVMLCDRVFANQSDSASYIDSRQQFSIIWANAHDE